nr:IS200/IS605 family transposase [uncultured Carboxylicivirga sp.]
MANTYSQIYIQIIFAIQNREASIQPQWEAELQKYISGIVKEKGQKMLSINGTYNHIHFLVGMKPNCCLSDLVREIKKSSTNFIEDKGFSRYKFQWQEGFGAFSYGQSQLNSVIKYIENQKVHHNKCSFKDEYVRLLKLFNVEFIEQYLFDWHGE